MKRSINISLFIFALSAAVSAQVIDTSKNINTWQLKHNFTRFEDVPIDTNMHQLQRDYNPIYDHGFSYESVGILGHAVNHVDFMRRPDPGFFLFGRAWEPYLKTPERATFYNTKTPFTSLAYTTVPVKEWKEENIEVLHTQNGSPHTNFGIEFNILAGKELFINQETRVSRVGLFGSHVKNRYSFFGTFYYNDFKKLHDNAGLVNLDSFLLGAKEEWWDYEMNLFEAHSHYRNMSLFTTQKYNLVERQTFTDSLGNTTSTGKTVSLSHQLLVERQFKDYTDVVIMEDMSPVYDNYYYLIGAAKDSASEDKISNVFQLIIGDPDHDKISARVSAGHEFMRFGWLSPDPAVDSLGRDTIVARFHSEIYNNVHVGLHLAGPTTGTWDWVIDGKYYLLGYYQNDFRINTTFSRELAGKAHLGIRGSFELNRPHYFTNHYSSSFFHWDNDFPSMLRIRGEAFVTTDDRETDIRVGAAYISNYVYWDQDALPRVYDQDLLVLSAHFSRHFKLSGYNSENKILIQYTTADEILRLPLASLYTSNYWKQSLFKGALIADLGFDLHYTTKYRASGYMPATGVFHLQDEAKVGGYPFLDVFLAFRVQRTRIFVSYNNLLHGMGFVGNDFFTAYRYPMRPRHFKMGLVWNFYD